MHFLLKKVHAFSLLLFWTSLLSFGTYGNPLQCLGHFKCQFGAEKTIVTCSDPGIDVVPLCLNPNLVRLTLQDTKIHTLYLTSLRYYAELKYVNLSQNKISKIEKRTFEYQHNMEELYLNDNKLSQLDVEVFFGLKNLTVLSLHDNLLEEIPDEFFHQVPNLEHLDLSHNRIFTIKDATFSGLSKLLVLNFSHNKITTIPRSSFRLVPHLSELSIGGNPFNRIESSDFSMLTAIDSLDLSSINLRKSLLTDTFHFISGLRTLKLDNCQLTDIPTGPLVALPQLEKVHLSSNLFTEVATDSFLGNPRLTSVTITGCPQLERVKLGAFRNNLNLEHIDLSRNPNLTYLPHKEFRSLMQLSYLDLHGNNLQYIPHDAVLWEEVNNWYLHYNPVACNCSSAWLRKLLIELNHTVPAVKCASPIKLRGIALSSTELSDLLCGLDSATQSAVIAFSICSLMLAIACGVIFVLYRHRGSCVRQMLKGKKWERNGRGSANHRSYDSDYPCIKPVPVTEL